MIADFGITGGREHERQIVHCSGVILVYRLAVPLHGFSSVLTNACPVGIHGTETELPNRETLLGCFAHPFRSFVDILGNSLTLCVEHSKIGLAMRIAVLRDRKSVV